MILSQYTLEIILLYVLLRLFNYILKKSIIFIRSNTEKNKSDKGIISIKDLQLKDYDRFINCIRFYLFCNFYDNIELFEQNDIHITEGYATLNTEKVYIYCIQNEYIDSDGNNEDNWTQTDITTLKVFVSKLISQGLTKGLVINNSTFTDDALEYMYKINHSDIKINITIIDGYDFTRLLRRYREEDGEEDFINVLE